MTTPHPALSQLERLPMVFTAHSAETAYLKERICAFVLTQHRVPVNPFMALGYFLYGMVDKDLIRRANNTLVRRCDELWAFGEPSDGVVVEIELAERAGIAVRHFDISHHGDRITEAVVTP